MPYLPFLTLLTRPSRLRKGVESHSGSWPNGKPLCFSRGEIWVLPEGNVETNYEKEEKPFLRIKRPYDFWINPNKMW
jgi:hypothetical protein